MDEKYLTAVYITRVIQGMINLASKIKKVCYRIEIERKERLLRVGDIYLYIVVRASSVDFGCIVLASPSR